MKPTRKKQTYIIIRSRHAQTSDDARSRKVQHAIIPPHDKMRHQIFIHGPHHLRHRTPPQRAITPPLRFWVCGSPIIIIRNKAKPDPLGERIRQQRGRARLDEIFHLPGLVDDLPDGRPARFEGGAAEGG